MFICRSVTIRYKRLVKTAFKLGQVMLATLAFATVLATAAPLPAAAHAAQHPFELAQANCQGAAQQVVAQTGGQLLSVSPTGNGQCQVTVLVPGGGDERPRKRTVTVPAS